MKTVCIVVRLTTITHTKNYKGSTVFSFYEKSTKKFCSVPQKRQDFVMAAILAKCRAYKIEDTVDGTVSEQVKNGLSCSLVICDYRKVQELYETLADTKAARLRNGGNFG